MSILSTLISLSPIYTILFLILAVVAIVLIMRVGFLRRSILSVLAIFPAIILALLSLLAVPLWRPLMMLQSKIPFVKDLPEKAEVFVNWLAARHKNLLAEGKREEFAQDVWKPKDFPWLYKKIPADIERPLWEDGRLTGGYDLTWLADRHITSGLIKEAARAGIIAATLFVVVPLILFLLASLASIFEPLGQAFSADPTILEKWPDGSVIEESRAGQFGQALKLALLAFLGFILRGILFLLAWGLFGTGVGILTMLVVIEKWRREKAEPYEIVSKDSHVRWPHRAEMRYIANRSYAKQIELSNGYLKNTSLFNIGKSTGTLRLRGDLNAPLRDIEMNLDGDSMFQHLMVLGGTGEGKTTAILKPLLKQFLAQKHMGLYVCDAKGVLWDDARKIAEAAGRKKDIRIIGTGKGQYGVDVISALNPSQITSVLRSVLTQLGGDKGGDSFWPDMAASLMRHVLTIGQTFAHTKVGQHATAPDGETINPYSLWWAYQAILDEARLKQALDEIDSALAAAVNKMPDEETYAALTSAEVTASRQYLRVAWEEMAKNTKTGIMASISQLMDGFSGASELRKRFISGSSDNTITILEALNGKILLSALSNVEDGLPANLVNILLKTCLYREARLREAKFKSKGKNPQDAPCVVMMDEVQEIVTVDPSSGLSDASFWNVARSTGLIGVFATQTIAALEQAMGEAAAKNFLQQARSKVFLRSEDQATVDYACWCAGEFERNRVFDNDQKESIDHRLLVDGWNPVGKIDPKDNINIESGWDLLLGAAKMMVSLNRQQIGEAQSKATYTPDLRFVPQGGFGLGEQQKFSVSMARIQALQAAHWRAEDLEHKYRTEGNQMTAALTPADIIGMGRWHAYALIQRAGAMRQDIISLNHDYG